MPTPTPSPTHEAFIWALAVLGVILVGLVFIGSIGVEILKGLLSLAVIGVIALIVIPVYLLGRKSSR